MLHAELHGKLSSDATDSDRREDILTSTVFGLLFATGAWQTLIDWFARARGPTGSVRMKCDEAEPPTYWFWPRMDDAEPDLVFNVGDSVIVVEAKYFSGKSGGDGDVDADDQLAREWRACMPTADQSAYPERLRLALKTNEVALVYLVRRARWDHERKAMNQSLAHVPDARLFLLTWEDLDEQLASVAPNRWIDELRTYLAGRDLAAFRGFSSCLSSTTSSTLSTWRLRLIAPKISFSSCFATKSSNRLSALATRNSCFAKDRDG